MNPRLLSNDIAQLHFDKRVNSVYRFQGENYWADLADNPDYGTLKPLWIVTLDQETRTGAEVLCSGSDKAASCTLGGVIDKAARKKDDAEALVESKGFDR